MFMTVFCTEGVVVFPLDEFVELIGDGINYFVNRRPNFNSLEQVSTGLISYKVVGDLRLDVFSEKNCNNYIVGSKVTK